MRKLTPGGDSTVWACSDGSFKFLVMWISAPVAMDHWKKGHIKVSSLKVDEVKVKVYGDIAVSFVLDTETTSVNGKDVSGQYRTTDIFAKRDGKWKIVASHACKVEK